MQKKIQIHFPLKSANDMASRLGVSKTRAGQILTIIDEPDTKRRRATVKFSMKTSSAKRRRGAAFVERSDQKSKSRNFVAFGLPRRSNAKKAR